MNVLNRLKSIPRILRRRAISAILALSNRISAPVIKVTWGEIQQPPKVSEKEIKVFTDICGGSVEVGRAAWLGRHGTAKEFGFTVSYDGPEVLQNVTIKTIRRYRKRDYSKRAKQFGLIAFNVVPFVDRITSGVIVPMISVGNIRIESWRLPALLRTAGSITVSGLRFGTPFEIAYRLEESKDRKTWNVFRN